MDEGYIDSIRGHWRQALTELETAKADDRSNPWVYASAGFNKMHLGRSAEGVTDVETALRLSPSDNAAPQWQAYLCYLRAHLAQWKQAIANGAK